jgi:hypothetical protein
MAVRGSSREAIKDNVRSIQKETRKAYVYWAVGIMISALGLKPSSINAAGFALTIERPEVIQGVLYLAALYQAVTALMMLQKGVNPFSKRVALRQCILGALPKGTRSFRGKSQADLVKVRKTARFMAKFLAWLHAIPSIVLIFLILVFKPKLVATAIGAIFSSSF